MTPLPNLDEINLRLLQLLGEGKSQSKSALKACCKPGCTDAYFNVRISRLRQRLQRINPYFDIAISASTDETHYQLVRYTPLTLREIGIRDI